MAESARAFATLEAARGITREARGVAVRAGRVREGYSPTERGYHISALSRDRIGR